MQPDDSHLTRLAQPATCRALARAGFAWSATDGNTAAALRFKRCATDPPAIVGLIGGASSGKSTIFNSLVQREASRISPHAHETLGPIVAAHDDLVDRLRAWVGDDRLLGGSAFAETDDASPTTGCVESLALCAHPGAALRGLLLCDLPDVTSKSSADEGAITRTLLPFFDGLVVVVDEERWFDATVFEDFLAHAHGFGPRVWVVFNRTERDDALTADQHARLARIAEQHHAAAYCVCPYQPGTGYRPVTAESRETLLGWLESTSGAGRRGELAAHLQRRAGAVVAENVRRSEEFDQMRRAVDDVLATVARDTSLTLDLLTAEERGLLGLGHRFVPLYDLMRQAGRWFSTLSGRSAARDVDFDKRPEALANVLRRNLELRFDRATARVDEQVANLVYFPINEPWENTWTTPEVDAEEWARRIRAHVDAWKDEAKAQARRGDLAAVSIGTPLLLADLLFLGGAGLTMTWATAWVAGFLGGKGVARLAQRSPAYAAYQTTVKAYQSLLREALVEQWEANRERMPQRHLKMTHPILTSLMHWSTPGRT